MAHKEFHTHSTTAQQNWLRAGVLGANDGIVSLAALIVGVAGAAADIQTILITGVAGLLAGALSMAAGEYVSVSSQRDTERALLDKERYELKHEAEAELAELTSIYEEKGLSPETAKKVAEELTAHDVFAAHAEAELKIDPNNLTSPWQASLASAVSFSIGAIIPVLAVLFAPEGLRISMTFASVLIALLITGIVSAKVSGAPLLRVVLRTVLGGGLAMVVTFGIGHLFGTSV